MEPPHTPATKPEPLIVDRGPRPGGGQGYGFPGSNHQRWGPRQCRPQLSISKWPGQLRFATIGRRPDMEPNSGSRNISAHEPEDHVLWPCVSLDLEVGRNDDRIHALAGVRSDTGQSVAIPRIGRNLAPGAGPAGRPCLRRGLRAGPKPHRLRPAPPAGIATPAMDTLRLNPLAFHCGSGHYLVKHHTKGYTAMRRCSWQLPTSQVE